jgi:hypothetical protein
MWWMGRRSSFSDAQRTSRREPSHVRVRVHGAPVRDGETLMNSRWSFALALCLVCLLLIATQSAYACPAGTVFSAYNGNGICAYIGQGATKAVQCTPMVNSCLPGTTHEHKTRGDTGDYCCPATIPKATAQHIECVWRGEAPACGGSCGPVEEYKGSAHNQTEADRNRTSRQYARDFGATCLSGAKVLCCHYGGF